MASPGDIRVTIDFGRVRANTESIRAACGVPVIAVVKADSYGLGAADAIEAIDDLVSGYYVFEPREVADAGLSGRTRRGFTAAWCGEATPDDLLRLRVRPAVWSAEQARRWRAARPVLAVDVGQQRFGAPEEAIDAVLATGECDEAYAHALTTAQAARFDALTADRGLRRHAAGSALLGERSAWFDAVRPGLALYREAVRVTTRLLEVRDGRGPAGYTGFTAPRFGIIRGGFADGLSAGAETVVNGVRRRLLEAGMLTSFVEAGAHDRAGDEVTLLGDGIDATEVAAAWNCSPAQVLWRFARLTRNGPGLRVRP
jgi:alanine racemase